MDWKVNIPKTKKNYETLLDQFISSELINVDAIALSEQELVEMLERRATNSCGISWFEQTRLYFSGCRLDSIIPHNTGGANPWTQIVFEPTKNLGIVTPGRFTFSSPVVFPHSGIVDREQYKANEILGCQVDYQNLGYFENRLGQSYILCYRFPTRNSFNFGSTYDCVRFAVVDYKREALLLTQGYAINYLMNHPMECFPGLVMDGSKGRLMDREKMKEIFTPIFEARRNELSDIKGRIEQRMAAFHLEPEII